ncbi:MAG: hypothetical protein B7Y36_05455 [Novosphingobium sp. 28-62-57]|uniref:DUF2497 domain-containing protein n=1 Tax=unclassified Novosphingobium TaxID=2644732 RepID=UPI000BC5317A|nr:MULTISPECIES: DUF2497 domain-containing protein [unclassified Novosphingobium]OYW50304.1 MAG: hypothetical protein B7Z34_05460 [Novosphingobium sp. 12-62-10]OYZ11592.1 MAG: hypothetical protein B7Y36_05455 [Novosphingobium sp. 28-62-57]OZA32373.1 MAG: hypothetical protein B7X92_12535 [Novosphingobium sp. 17-62-9]HQS70286.1 DUF2497 domain-containing protein [Novosphingobium sp.]
MRQAGEPSVEEILESIKSVIARDSKVEAQARLRSESRFDSKPTPRREVLELTETAEHDDTEDEAESGGLIADAAAASMRESLAALSMLAQPGAAPQIVRSGETSLEGLVRELLRPMLAEWLDKHLPAMVEKMVAAEIARIAGKRG